LGSIPVAHSITSVDAVGVTDFPPRDFPIKEPVLRSRAQLERTTFEKQTCELGIKPTIRLLPLAHRPNSLDLTLFLSIDYSMCKKWSRNLPCVHCFLYGAVLKEAESCAALSESMDGFDIFKGERNESQT
jgi:hypothetical protein